MLGGENKSLVEEKNEVEKKIHHRYSLGRNLVVGGGKNAKTQGVNGGNSNKKSQGTGLVKTRKESRKEIKGGKGASPGR